jgi:hypothetical protein
VVAEVERPGTDDQSLTVRIESGATAGPWFSWARVGTHGFSELAQLAGLSPTGVLSRNGRWFGKAVKR